MRRACLLILIMVSPATFADVHKYECYPKEEYASSWPVDAIYLHGLFTADSADTNGWRKLEADNRVKLRAMADKLKIKIAIPVAPIGGKNTRNWNSTSLAKIEAMAKQACGGKPLAKPRALIGFSNGGYKARQVANEACGTYSKVLALGAVQSGGSNSCGNLVNHSRHDGGLDPSFINGHLAVLRRNNGATVTPSGTNPPAVR